MLALIKTPTYTSLGRHYCPLAQSGKLFWKKIFWGLTWKLLWKTFFCILCHRGCYWPTTITGFVLFKLNQIGNIDALPCTGCLWTRVSGNSRSRSFLGMEGLQWRPLIPVPDLWEWIFYFLPVPGFWKCFFPFPSHSRILGMEFFIPFPIPNLGIFSRSRPFPWIEASKSHSPILGMDFFPSRSRILGIPLFHSLPVPELWEWISFRNLGIIVLLVLQLLVLTTAPHSLYNDSRQLEWMREPEDEKLDRHSALSPAERGSRATVIEEKTKKNNFQTQAPAAFWKLLFFGTPCMYVSI